ncbi:MAG TPA: hypothetical protein PKA64_26865, partial [Myxococcota bacterium]|nr:hypothetical protein [Myxococcota bacterium]
MRYGLLGPLAARPITLRMLIQTFGQGPLPDSRAALYAAAMTHMVADPRPNAPPERPRERLAAAGRVAAALMLTGRAAVELDPTHEAADTIPLRELIGPERDQSGAWPMDERHLKDALCDTPVFVASGATSRRFGHHTFAEYLAARHLLDHGYHGQRALDLLRPAGSVRVAPPLRGLATWMAALDEDAKNLLVDADPATLVYADPGALSDDLRARLVVAYLDAIARGDEPEPTFSPFPRSLAHPGLHTQLARRLKRPERRAGVDPIQDLMVRRTALRLAREASVITLALQALRIATDRQEPDPLRQEAARAAAALDPEATHVDPWRRLAHGEAGPDPDHERRGVALAVLWRARRAEVDLHRALDITPSIAHFGAFTLFLDKLADDLSPDHLPVVVGALRRWDRHAAEVAELRARVWAWSWERAATSPEARAYIVEELLDDRALPPPVPHVTAKERRSVLDDLVADPGCDEHDLGGLMAGTIGLVTHADHPWAIARRK